ncbi:retroelement pol polyprotein-like protein, partial [Tanacetum coccineum]
MVNKKGPKDEAAGSSKVTNSHYYLGLNDNPGNIITQVKLCGPNYEEWARAMKTSLRARRKFGFIDETIKQSTEASELEYWWTVLSMLVSWIMNTIEPSLRIKISYVEEASALWKDIKERFSVANGPRIQQLKFELAGLQTRRLVDCLLLCCFDINGYPEWWGDRPKFEGNGKGTMTQQQKPNPPGGRGRGGQPRENAASVSGALELGNINAETLQALVNLLNSQKSSNENMTGLPNGDQAVATKSGIVNLDGKIKLLNVLYVPQL